MKLTFIGLLCCIIIFSCSAPDEEESLTEQIHCRIANSHIAIANAIYGTEWDDNLEAFTEYVNTNYADELVSIENDFQTSFEVMGIEETHNKVNQAITDKIGNKLVELESEAITNGTRALPCYDAFLQSIDHFNDCEKVGLAGIGGIVSGAYCKIRIISEATEAFCKCIEITYNKPCQ